MKRILINATQREELRVAIVDGQQLFDLDIDTASHEQRKSNFYKGRVTRVEPSLEACFVDYGAERHGFLPLKEIAREYLRDEPGNHNIREQISEGAELVVQVEKDERGNKGAALTTFASLAGRFLVLMPNSPKVGGISRRVEGAEREELRQALAEVQIPDGMGAIARTNGIGRSPEELQWDVDHLVSIWKAITEAANARHAPFLIYQENNIVLRALRDYLRPDIGEVVVDSVEVYEQARSQMAYSMPGELPKLKLYRDNIPLFSRYQIESQIESAHQRLVRLPSGGSIVIDRGEALTAIDVNSAKSTGSGGIEETAYKTNLEAVDEVARQLRLRDLGGLVVVDFIDMGPSRNQRDVERHLEQACAIDRARVQIGHLSRFGLMEMSRQRLRPSLGEHSLVTCPQCEGRGAIRSIESLSLSVLRLIEEECMKDRTAGIIAQLPVDIATFLLNEKRATVNELAERYNEFVTLIPNETLRSPHFEIQRVRANANGEPETTGLSYALAQDFEAEARARRGDIRTTAKALQPAVSDVLPDAPAPLPPDAPDPVVVKAAPPETVKPSWWKRLLGWFGLGGADQALPAIREADHHHRRPGASRSNTPHGEVRRNTAERNGNPAARDRRGRTNSTNNQNAARGGNSRRGSNSSQRNDTPHDDNRNGAKRNETNRSGNGNNSATRNTANSNAQRTGNSGRNDPPAHADPAIDEAASAASRTTPSANANPTDGAANPGTSSAAGDSQHSGRRRRRGRRGRGGRGVRGTESNGAHQTSSDASSPAPAAATAPEAGWDIPSPEPMNDLPSANPALRATVRRPASDITTEPAPNKTEPAPSPAYHPAASTDAAPRLAPSRDHAAAAAPALAVAPAAPTFAPEPMPVAHAKPDAATPQPQPAAPVDHEAMEPRHVEP